MNEWTVYRLTGEPLATLAGKGTQGFAEQEPKSSGEK